MDERPPYEVGADGELEGGPFRMLIAALNQVWAIVRQA
jgi:hypothetical protein